MELCVESLAIGKLEWTNWHSQRDLLIFLLTLGISIYLISGCKVVLIFLFLIASELGDLYILVNHLGLSFYKYSIFLLYFMFLFFFFLLLSKTRMFILDTNPMTFRHCQYCKNFLSDAIWVCWLLLAWRLSLSSFTCRLEWKLGRRGSYCFPVENSTRAFRLVTYPHVCVQF